VKHEKELNEISKLFFCPQEFKKYSMEFSNLYAPGILKNQLVMIGDSRLAGFPVSQLKLDIPIVNGGVGGTTVIGWSGHEVVQSIINQGGGWLFSNLAGNDLGGNATNQHILGCLCRLNFAVQDYCNAKILVHGVLPVIQHGNADNVDVKKYNKLCKQICDICGWQYINFFDEFYNPLTGWCRLAYLNLPEAGPLPPQEIIFAAEYGNRKAMRILMEKYWPKIRPVHFSSEGNARWLELLQAELKKVVEITGL